MSKIKLFFSKYKNTKLGFTLLETLVAISIFTMSVLTLLVILGQGIASTSFSKNKIIATYLAQGGVERVRNIRDSYMLSDPSSAQAGWTSFVQGLDTWGCSLGCYVDESFDIAFCNDGVGGKCLPIKYDSNTGVYGYVDGVDSGFVLKLTSETVNANEQKIHGIVTWNSNGQTQQVDFSDNLFNWIEQ